MGGGGRTWANFGGLTQSLVGESEEKRWPGGSEHEWFLGCCDASDVIDGDQCIISIMRGSGGNANRLPIPGVRVYVEDRKQGTTGWKSG